LTQVYSQPCLETTVKVLDISFIIEKKTTHLWDKKEKSPNGNKAASISTEVSKKEGPLLFASYLFLVLPTFLHLSDCSS
jgi:hypothetical protein